MTETLAVRRDYRSFLARCQRDLRPEDARLDNLPSPKTRARRVEWWVEEIAVLLGATSFAKQLARVRNDHYFWDKRLSPYVYVIGRTYEDDPILQVARGKHAGQILLFDHESYYGSFEELAKLVGGERPSPAFWKRAQPIMARRGYTSGRPTADQVVAVLLDEKLDGAERISGSFDELYASVHLYCERRPKPRAPSRGRKITLTEIHLGNRGFGDTKIVTGDAVAYVAPGGVGVVAMSPGRVPVEVARVDTVHALAAAGPRLYMVSKDDEDAETTLAVSSDGGRRFKVIAPGDDISDVVADGRGVSALLDRRLVHYPISGRSLPSIAAGNCYKLGGSSPAGRIAFASDELRLLRHATRAKSIDLPDRVRDIEDVIVTKTGAILVATTGSGVLRSTDNGASWRTVPDTTSAAWKCGMQLSTNAVVVGGTNLLISHDDGQTFAVLTAAFRGWIEGVAEVGGELLLAASQHVYCVRISDLAADGPTKPARGFRGVKPIKAKEQRAPLRPLSSYAPVIRERVWQIEPFDKTKLYVASVRHGAVRVLENGSRVVYSKKLSRELPGRFSVHSGWLVYETSPREVEREKRRAAKQAAEWGTGKTLSGVLRMP